MKRLVSTVLVLAAIFTAHGGENGELRVPVQDQIPIRGCYVSEAIVYIQPLDGLKFFERKDTSGLPRYQQVKDGGVLTVVHEAALSSSTLQSYLSAAVKMYEMCDTELTKLYGEFKGCSKVKTSVSHDAAYLEIDELVFANERRHLYQKVIRTPEGFATISVFCQSRDWESLKGNLLKSVASARLMSVIEQNSFKEYPCVYVDTDGDVFTPMRRKLQYQSLSWTSCRNYFRNKNKNLLEEKQQIEKANEDARKKRVEKEREELERPVHWRINAFFGYTIGRFPQTSETVKKLNDGSFLFNTSLKAKQPFDVFKTAKLYYTKDGALLYKVRLMSKVIANANIVKMRKRLAEIAEAVAAKHGGILSVVTSNANSYEAKFIRKVDQSLTMRIAEAVGPDNTKGWRFEMEFEDCELKENGLKSIRFREGPTE